MSKQSAVLAKVDEIAARLGVRHLADGIKREISSVWGEDTPAAPAAPATTTFDLLVGVEVLNSAGARRGDVVAAVKQALDSAASRRSEVVSLSVAPVAE